jgi:hypothetical protein
MSVSRIVQQLTSDAVEPEALAQIVKLLCRFHLTSATCTHWANMESPSFLAAYHVESSGFVEYLSKKMSSRGLRVAITTARMQRETAVSSLLSSSGNIADLFLDGRE